MHKDTLTDDMGLKIFFLDVGQGDGVLLEVGNYKILIDAGPNNNMHGYLTKWQYTYLLNAKEKIHIDYLIISHFDADHYKGTIKILNNPNFTFGTIIHPGILKFAARTNRYDTDLGQTVQKDNKVYLSQIFDNLLSVKQDPPFNRDISSFVNALQKAASEGRAYKAKRYEKGKSIVSKKIEGNSFRNDQSSLQRERYFYQSDERSKKQRRYLGFL